MKIYTKTGDDGTTGLFGGGRVSKASDRVDAYGDVDELNSSLGVALAEGLDDEADALVADIQCRLFDLGAELASSRPVDDPAMPRIEEQDVATLERAIDRIEAKLEPLKSFIVPGGSRAAAQLHVARTVSRRAERRLVALTAHEAVRGELMRYLNRLSDLLFMMARDANRQRGVADVPWQGRARSAASSRESS